MENNKLSAYVLTFNSELHLFKILEQIHSVADDILVIDSGSSDQTESIVSAFPNVKFIYHPFTDFKSQRSFAANACRFDYVLFLDSDEIPDDNFITNLKQLKQAGFDKDAYEAERHWKVLGKNVRVLYPIVSPDFPIRLYNRQIVSFEHSSLVHETPYGYKSKGKIAGRLLHITFENRAQLEKKLSFYSDIAARDLILKNKKTSLAKAYASAFSAFIKWYFLKRGFLDGLVGLILANYASRYSKLKYLKAIRIKKNRD